MPRETEIGESFVLSLREGTTLVEQDDGSVALRSGAKEIRFAEPPPGFRQAMASLLSEGATEARLLDLTSESGSLVEVTRMAYCLRLLRRAGMLCHTIVWCRAKLATLVPLASGDYEIPNEPQPESLYVMSRFAYIHKESEQLVVESPLSAAKLVLYDSQAMILLNSFVKPLRLTELYCAAPFLRGMTVLFIRMLLACRILSEVDGNVCSEVESTTLSQWEFHDLVFHTKSRLGRHLNAYGATFRFRGEIAPLPAIKPVASNDRIALYRPDIRSLCESDLPFTQVLEARRTIREYGERPITIEQLGAFLYRTARVRKTAEVTPEGYTRTNRPYPGGGACYELELYLAVNVCEGLLPGLYHYCPKKHQFSKLSGGTREVERLLERAYYAADERGTPQVLIILAARFQRASWKYSAMAYATVLKNVGVLYQTMYLVATAMGLAPCALGGGDSDVFVAATGGDYYAETSVGEFLLGSKPS